MCKVDSLCYCLFAVGGGRLHPPIPRTGLALSIFLPFQQPSTTTPSELMLSTSPSTLQPFNPSTLQPFNPSTLQPFNPSTPAVPSELIVHLSFNPSTPAVPSELIVHLSFNPSTPAAPSELHHNADADAILACSPRQRPAPGAWLRPLSCGNAIRPTSAHPQHPPRSSLAAGPSNPQLAQEAATAGAAQLLGTFRLTASVLGAPRSGRAWPRSCNAWRPGTSKRCFIAAKRRFKDTVLGLPRLHPGLAADASSSTARDILKGNPVATVHGLLHVAGCMWPGWLLHVQDASRMGDWGCTLAAGVPEAFRGAPCRIRWRAGNVPWVHFIVGSVCRARALLCWAWKSGTPVVTTR